MPSTTQRLTTLHLHIDEATLSRISDILQREFDAEISVKSQEIKLIEQRLQQAQVLLDKLCGYVAFSILQIFFFLFSSVCPVGASQATNVYVLRGCVVVCLLRCLVGVFTRTLLFFFFLISVWLLLLAVSCICTCFPLRASRTIFFVRRQQPQHHEQQQFQQ